MTPLLIILLVPAAYLLNICIVPLRIIQEFGIGVVNSNCNGTSLSRSVVAASFFFDLFFFSTIHLSGLPFLTHFLSFSVLYMVYSLDEMLR
jgi:hypothetical protein